MIKQLYEQSPTFREVCADYHTAISSLADLRSRRTSEPANDDALLCLLADLERELEQYFD